MDIKRLCGIFSLLHVLFHYPIPIIKMMCVYQRIHDLWLRPCDPRAPASG